MAQKTGTPGDDIIIGTRYQDKLSGGAGNDTIRGGGHRDTLGGGAGNDVLSGGTAADSFNFTGAFGHDVITDLGDTDKIHLPKNCTAHYCENAPSGRVRINVFTSDGKTALGTIDVTNRATLPPNCIVRDL